MAISDKERRFGSELPAWATTILIAIVGSGSMYILNNMSDRLTQAQAELAKISDSQARIETHMSSEDQQLASQGGEIVDLRNRMGGVETRVSVLEARRK